jgi:hypothetical protein
MPDKIIHIHDVARDATYDLTPGVRVLRVPYEMFNPAGAVRVHGALVEWEEGAVSRTARFAEAWIEDCHAGERVLVRLGPDAPEDEWWLCEVEPAT